MSINIVRLRLGAVSPTYKKQYIARSEPSGRFFIVPDGIQSLIMNGAIIRVKHTNIRMVRFSMKYGITHRPMPATNGTTLAYIP